MADRRIENSRLLRHRLVRGSVHYASTPTLVSVGLNDQDPSPYSSTSSNEDSAIDSSDINNDMLCFYGIARSFDVEHCDISIVILSHYVLH